MYAFACDYVIWIEYSVHFRCSIIKIHEYEGNKVKMLKISSRISKKIDRIF